MNRDIMRPPRKLVASRSRTHGTRRSRVQRSLCFNWIHVSRQENQPQIGKQQRLDRLRKRLYHWRNPFFARRKCKAETKESVQRPLLSTKAHAWTSENNNKKKKQQQQQQQKKKKKSREKASINGHAETYESYTKKETCPLLFFLKKKWKSIKKKNLVHVHFDTGKKKEKKNKSNNNKRVNNVINKKKRTKRKKKQKGWTPNWRFSSAKSVQ